MLLTLFLPLCWTVANGSLYVVPLWNLRHQSNDDDPTCEGEPPISDVGGGASKSSLHSTPLPQPAFTGPALGRLPDDVLVIPSNGSRAKPSALVW